MSHELSESEIFVLLAKRRRRLVLQILQECSAPLSARELAEYIGNCEYENPSTNDVMTIQLTLYHRHLPKLEEADVVTYDESEGTVWPGEHFGAPVRFLEEVIEDDLPWSDG